MKNKEELARIEGARWVMELIKEKGVDEATKELEWRGVWNIPLKVANSQITDLIDQVKGNCTKTICCLSATVLRDEFGFGKDRLNRFIDRFNDKAECLTRDFVRWKDIQDNLKEETGISFEIPDACEVHKGE